VDATQLGLRPVVAINDAGLTQWAWEASDGLASQFGLAGWTTPRPWAQGSVHSGDLAVAAHGEAISAAWMENQDGSDRIFYNVDTFATIHLPTLQLH